MPNIENPNIDAGAQVEQQEVVQQQAQVEQAAVPIEVIDSSEAARTITVQRIARGVAAGVKNLFDAETLREANVLGPNDAHDAQDIARGALSTTDNTLVARRAHALVTNSHGEIKRWQ